MASYATRESRQWSHDGMSEEDRRAYHRLYDRARRNPEFRENQERTQLRLIQIVTAAFPEVFARGTGVDWQSKQQRKDVA